MRLGLVLGGATDGFVKTTDKLNQWDAEKDAREARERATAYEEWLASNPVEVGQEWQAPTLPELAPAQDKPLQRALKIGVNKLIPDRFGADLPIAGGAPRVASGKTPGFGGGIVGAGTGDVDLPAVPGKRQALPLPTPTAAAAAPQAALPALAPADEDTAEVEEINVTARKAEPRLVRQSDIYAQRAAAARHFRQMDDYEKYSQMAVATKADEAWADMRTAGQLNDRAFMEKALEDNGFRDVTFDEVTGKDGKPAGIAVYNRDKQVGVFGSLEEAADKLLLPQVLRTPTAFLDWYTQTEQVKQNERRTVVAEKSQEETARSNRAQEALGQGRLAVDRMQAGTQARAVDADVRRIEAGLEDRTDERTAKRAYEDVAGKDHVLYGDQIIAAAQPLQTVPGLWAKDDVTGEQVFRPVVAVQQARARFEAHPAVTAGLITVGTDRRTGERFFRVGNKGYTTFEQAVAAAGATKKK